MLVGWLRWWILKCWEMFVVMEKMHNNYHVVKLKRMPKLRKTIY